MIETTTTSLTTLFICPDGQISDGNSGCYYADSCEFFFGVCDCESGNFNCCPADFCAKMFITEHNKITTTFITQTTTTSLTTLFICPDGMVSTGNGWCSCPSEMICDCDGQWDICCPPDLCGFWPPFTRIATTTTLLPLTNINFESTPPNQECQSGWTLYNGDYYCYNQISLNNADASSWCASNGATLINIHNQQDLSFALSLANHGASFWVNINILN